MQRSALLVGVSLVVLALALHVAALHAFLDLWY